MATSHSNWILIGTILITMFVRSSRIVHVRLLLSPIVQRRGIATSPIAIPPGISDPIKRDHRKIESYYGKITNSSDKDEQTLFQNLSVQLELAQHSIGEELVVYPVFETLLADGADIAIKDRKEHLKVKRALKAFQDMTTSDTQFISTIKELMENLSEHIKEEETDDLPKLEVALSQEDSQSNAKSFGRTKMFVPSRAHPSAPDKPPFETVAGLLTAPIDHLADLFRKWPDTSGMPNPSTK